MNYSTKRPSALQEYAKIFFSLHSSKQDDWAYENFRVTSRTFRRWCKACGIEPKITKHVEI